MIYGFLDLSTMFKNVLLDSRSIQHLPTKTEVTLQQQSLAGVLRGLFERLGLSGPYA